MRFRWPFVFISIRLAQGLLQPEGVTSFLVSISELQCCRFVLIMMMLRSKDCVDSFTGVWLRILTFLWSREAFIIELQCLLASGIIILL
jgi:hypothetical protein